MKICFLVESADISGGTNVIFQHALFMHKHGVQVTIALNQFQTYNNISWHREAHLLKFRSIEEASQFDYNCVIATWWKTTLLLHKFRSENYVYFVQSIESRFYPQSDLKLVNIVNQTYNLNIRFITIATWMQNYLRTAHGKSSALIRNGIQKDIFTRYGDSFAPRPTSKPRIIIEGYFGVSFKNTALAMRIAKEAGIDDIWVLTGSNTLLAPGSSRLFSRLALKDTAKVYRSCDILLKLSTVEGMFGPPLEMFHCGGTSVVFDVTGYDEYIINDVNSIVCNKDNLDDVVVKLRELYNNPVALERLKHGAMLTAQAWPSWEQSSAAFHEHIVTSCMSSTNKYLTLRNEVLNILDDLYDYERTTGAIGNNRLLPNDVFKKSKRFVLDKLRLVLHTIRVCREIWSVARSVKF